MPKSRASRGNFLQGIHGDRTRRAVNALDVHETTNYETSTAAGAATGLNGTNRVRNSATLVNESNLSVDVPGNATCRISGKLPVALTAANGIKLSFNGGQATIVTGTMGGVVTFNTLGSSNSATAIGATNAIPFKVALTALNTAIDGGTTNTWVEVDFWFVATFAVGGAVTLQFAQSSAGATNTDILPGAFIKCEPLDHVVT